jgi:DNA polymerase II small subunit/DNA polymerase delta subunit B
MSQNKKFFLVILLTAVISSCLTYFIASPTPQANINPMQQALQVNEKKAQAISQNYTLEMSQLKKQNDSLLKVVQSRRAALMLSDQKVFQLEDKVRELANKVQAEPDTTKEKVSDLDSLGIEASVLVSQEAERDSLCEGEVSDLNALVKEKDSALEDCQNSYISMRQVADSSLQQQQNAILQIKGLNKQLKKKAVQSRLLSAGILIITGVAATLYLSHQHP